MKRLLFLILLFVLFTSCSKDVPGQLDTNLEKNIQNSRYLSADEAANEAMHIYSMLYGSDVKSGNVLKVKDVTAVMKAVSGTKSDATEEDAALYVVNFEDDKGFAILLADRYKEDQIIGVSDKGYLSTDSIPDNPNLCSILINADMALARRDSVVGNPWPYEDSLKQEIVLPETYIETTPWELYTHADPLLESEWGQYTPYNSKLEPINEKLPPVGCVATAVAQIMGYYERPVGYDWDAMVDFVYVHQWLIDASLTDQFGTLFKELGEKLNMQYSLQGSSAPSENVPPTLWSYGYSAGELEEYSLEKIKNEILNKRPVYIEGFSFKEEVWINTFLWFGRYETSYSGGHAWVIDGFKGLRRQWLERDYETDEILSSRYQYQELLHCNLGNNEIYANGYYNDMAFDTNEGPVPSTTQAILREQGEVEGTDGFYQYNFRIITNIK